MLSTENSIGRRGAPNPLLWIGMAVTSPISAPEAARGAIDFGNSPRTIWPACPSEARITWASSPLSFFLLEQGVVLVDEFFDVFRHAKQLFPLLAIEGYRESP